jgi:hypothetical protein
VLRGALAHITLGRQDLTMVQKQIENNFSGLPTQDPRHATPRNFLHRFHPS